MTSRRDSTKSYRAIPRKPSVKPKSSHIEGNSLDGSETDYMNDDLLKEEYYDNDTSPPYNYQDLPKQPENDSRDIASHRLVIAIDYGTTYTGVAFDTPKSSEANIADIRVIDNWGESMSNSLKIPSVYSYSPRTNGAKQWGDSLSHDAVTMINTKLELDVQDNKIEELELILRSLEGMGNLNFEHVKASRGRPEYTWKSPEEIVTDYLTKVFDCVDQEVEKFTPLVKSRIPVDIVITVPVQWSYPAKNSTLRAVKAAGFNEQNFPNLQDIVMVTEPEAAAIYTARYLKSEMQKDFLKPEECFVLCDAGGGTVDVVSYQVTKLEPILELQQTGTPYSAKCGSAYIDTNFKQWLSRILGKLFLHLDAKSRAGKISRTSESSRMRHVMKQFDGHKRSFHETSPSMKIDLPEPIDKITVTDKIREGELTITNAEMRSFFDPCVDGVIELIQGQLQQIEKRGRRLKNVFLIGGFGESQYLQEELRNSMKWVGAELRRPDTSWTAVVRGAVIHGIEKTSLANVISTRTCQRSYGIVLNEVFSASRFSREDRYTDSLTNNVMAQQQITWLVKKGDLILPNEGKTMEKEFAFTFQETGDRKFKLPIYEYEHDDLPDRFQNAREELKQVYVLNTDLSQISLDKFERAENPRTRQPYYIAVFVCKMTMSGSKMEVRIVWDDTLLCRITIKDVEQSGSIESLNNDRRNWRQRISFVTKPESYTATVTSNSFSTELPEALQAGTRGSFG